MATQFKVREGYHVAQVKGGTKTYRKGQVFESDKPLHKVFPNKFDVVAINDVKAKKKRKDDADDEAPSKFPSVDPLEELGKDVSQKFPDAINQGLKVFQTEDGDYNVAEERDPTTRLNKKPLTKVATKRFLENR